MKKALLFLIFVGLMMGCLKLAHGLGFSGKRWKKDTLNWTDKEFMKHPDFGGDTFDIPFIYVNERFDSATIFSSSRFLSKADFLGTRFISSAYFGNVEFCCSASFQSVKFLSKVYFDSGTQFDSAAIFLDTQFDSAASFNMIKFHSTAAFWNAKFHSLADFSFGLFQSYAFFDGAHFDSLIDFNAVYFNSSAVFSNSHFHSLAKFYLTQFNTSADFSYSKFDSTADFTITYLPDTLYFENVSIKQKIDLTSARLDTAKHHKCKIDLLGTDLNRITINYDLFELYFPVKRYWPHLNLQIATYEQKISIYEKLLKRFKDDGFMESYKNLDIEYKNFIGENHGRIRHYINWFFKHWWNYGYNKEWVLAWAFSLLLLFTFINAPFFTYLNNNIYRIDAKAFYDLSSYYYRKQGVFLKVPKTLFNSFVYTAILFFGIKLVPENFQKPKWIGILYLMVIYIAGLFCLGYIINIVITKV